MLQLGWVLNLRIRLLPRRSRRGRRVIRGGRWERFEDYLRGYRTRGDMVGGLRGVGGCGELVGTATGW